MELINNLQEFGLSKKEAKVYLACLELGDSLASEVAIKSNLPRTLVYDIMERLIELGIISYHIKSGKKYFRASDPSELIRIVKEKENAVTNILPSLKKLQKLKGIKRPKVTVYEGKEGMKTVMNEILRSGVKEALAYGSSGSSFEIIPAFMEEWHDKRIKKKILVRIIYNNNEQTRKRVKERPKSLKYSKYKFMPVELNSPAATLIYGNKVILQLWAHEPFSVVIEDEQMVENQRKYFEEMWKIAKD